MNRKVLFLQQVHPETDDRIISQMMTLRRHGFTCTYAQARSNDDAADVIICDTPKAVLRNIGHTGIVIFDVTEWYPSKKNLRPFRPYLRPLAAVAMICLSLFAGFLTNRFIFGETDKGKPFRFLFLWKKHVYLPYYPSRQFFAEVAEERETDRPLRVLYAGPLTEEKGYFRALNVAKQAGVELTVIGPEQYMPLEDFCRYIRTFDVALDLRDRDLENRRCLPIKLFYYWAAGVVPIYSDLDAIRNQVPNAQDAMILVKSEQDAIAALKQLLNEPSLLDQYRKAGQQLYRDAYYWEAVEERLINVISQQ